MANENKKKVTWKEELEESTIINDIEIPYINESDDEIPYTDTIIKKHYTTVIHMIKIELNKERLSKYMDKYHGNPNMITIYLTVTIHNMENHRMTFTNSSVITKIFKKTKSSEESSFPRKFKFDLNRIWVTSLREYMTVRLEILSNKQYKNKKGTIKIKPICYPYLNYKIAFEELENNKICKINPQKLHCYSAKDCFRGFKIKFLYTDPQLSSSLSPLNKKNV